MGVWTHRLQRVAASGSPILFAGTVALLGLAVSSVGKGVNPIFLWPVLICSIVLLLFQITAEYRRRTYDPSWMFKLDDYFESEDMRNTRSRAAKKLKGSKTQLESSAFASAEIDDVVDFFEGMGFLVQGGQITPEVAHHAFHYWIEGYYLATKQYVEAKRQDRPAQWEFVEGLYRATLQVEQERVKRYGAPVNDELDDEKYVAEFLDGESELQDTGLAPVKRKRRR